MGKVRNRELNQGRSHAPQKLRILAVMHRVENSGQSLSTFWDLIMVKEDQSGSPTVILFSIIMAFILALSGCVKPAEPIPKPVPPKPTPVIKPTPDPISELPTLTVRAPRAILETLQELLGPAGNTVFNPSQPVVIVRPEATITLPPGSPMSYTTSDEKATFTFHAPYPQIKAEKAGFTFEPHLVRVDILPDDTGVATVQGSLYTKRQAFDLRPVGPAETIEDRSPAPDNEKSDPPLPIVMPPEELELPIVTVFSAAWCAACKPVIADLKTRSEFQVVVKNDDNQRPEWVTTLPTIYWESKPGKWSKFTPYKPWPGSAAFVEMWKKSKN